MNTNSVHLNDDSFQRTLTAVRFILLSIAASVLLTAPLSSEPETKTDRSTNQKTTADEKPFDGEACSIGGCSIGHHSIPALGPSTYKDLLNQFENQPISSESEAFEQLLYYGRQTRAYINQTGTPSLGDKRSRILKNELSRMHANVSVRIIDDNGNTRVRLRNHSVPLGKSKHFKMKNTINLKPPELSGTVYRVGVRHLWARY